MGGGKSKLAGVVNEDPMAQWKIIGDLGSGTYGKVRKVQNKSNNQIAAAKVAPIANDDVLMQFADEVSILTALQHPNITNFLAGYYFDGNLWILIEACSGGSLGDILKKIRRGFTDLQLRTTSQQLLTALVFLHSNFIIHRDLNASNILLAAGGVIKIADFGVSAKNKSDSQKRSSFIGSPHWMAPEVIACEKDKSQVYSYECDVWSFGVTLIELAETKVPYFDLHPMKVLFKIATGPPPVLTTPQAFSKAFNVLLETALVKDPTKRPSASTLLKLEFCTENLSTATLQEFLR